MDRGEENRVTVWRQIFKILRLASNHQFVLREYLRVTIIYGYKF